VTAEAPDRPGTGDLVLHGGTVWTGDSVQPSATAVAISKGRITAVGSDAEVLAQAPRGAEPLDLGGRLLCPGFIDAHTHFENACDWFFQVPVTGVTSGAELRARVERTLVGVPPGVWVTGGGDFGPGDAGAAAALAPRLAEIDEVSADNPVLLRRTDGRYFANTKALQIARLTGSDGLLERRIGEVVQRLVAPVSLEQKVVGAREVMAELGRLGITSIHDIARHPALSDRSIHSCHVERSYSNLAVFQELRRRGELGVRVYAFLTLDTFEGLAEEGIYPGAGDEWLRYGALKIFLDSGVMLPPFDAADAAGTGLKDDWSYRFVGAERLLERIVAGDLAGFDIGVHVQGDAAIRLALNCFQHAIRVNPPRDRRHRLIHAWHLAEDDFARAAGLGMVADVTPDHLLLYSRGLDKLLGEDRAGNAFAWRRMVDSGIVTNLVSDFPGAFDRSHVATVDPLRNMYVALTRKAADAEGTAFHPEQALRIDDVLHAYTSSPAYGSREEQLKGTISPGKVADLVVLSDDITRGGPDSLLTAKVDLTVLAGEVTHRRES
jgi:predicted amidohydrolase YtcJ